MTRDEFIERLANYVGVDCALEIADDFTDAEIEETGYDYIAEVAGDFREAMAIDHYRIFGW